MRIAAAILAGGKASRLGGIAKGLLTGLADVPLIQRLIGELAAAGIDEVILAANDPGPYARFGKTVVADLHLDIGPLGGIEAALDHLAGRCDSVLFLPCDLPNLSVSEMIAMVQAHQSAPDRVTLLETAESEHPLCAVVPVSVLPAVSAAVEAGHYGVSRLWRHLAAVAVRSDNSLSLLNINTSEDLRRWRHATG
jgi:molybdopterin-guanine dinucleotide biosynthesis protein A